MSKEHKSKGSTKPVLLYASEEAEEAEEKQGAEPEQQQPEPEPPKKEPEPETVLDFQYASEAFAHFEDQSNEWYASLTKSEKSAIADYTGSGYVGINDALREEGKYGKKLDDFYAKREKNINSALAKFETKDTLMLYRGASIACLPNFAKNSPEKLIGKTYFDNGFMSCGASEEAGWDRKVRFVITVPKGSKGAGAYVGEHSTCSHEGEYLLRSHSHFTVTDASKGSDGRITINMTLIPGKYNVVKKPQK